MVSIAVLADELPFGMTFDGTENVTKPLPVPVLPEVTLTQPAPEAAVHEQPAGTETLAVPVPPETGKNWLTGDTE